MGTWGEGPFDDDMASDWVWKLQEATGWDVVATALHRAADFGGNDDLEASDGQIAWAAATVVASVDDQQVAVPSEVTAWLDHHRGSRPAEIRSLALSAVRRVLADNSELADLWSEAGEEPEWRANVERVATVLG